WQKSLTETFQSREG
ncbi:iron complex transport system ATP-binding protein, partial [Candidatus Hakubella thermalkaliphila]